MPMNNVAGARQRVARWLVDRCSIAAKPTVEFDREEHRDVETAGADIYPDLACRVAVTGTQDRVARVGERAVSLRLFTVTVPWDTTDVAVDNVVTVTTSNDPDLVDRTMRVVDVQGMTDGAYRRLVCEEVLG